MTAIQSKEQIIATVPAVGPLLGEDEVASTFRLSVAAIRRWRLQGKGPRYIKVGAAVRYRLDDIRAWLETRPSGGEPSEVSQ